MDELHSSEPELEQSTNNTAAPPFHADASLLLLNEKLTKALADFAQCATTLEESGIAEPFDPALWPECQREAEAEARVDDITAQIRTARPQTIEGLAVKIRALAWDAGFWDAGSEQRSPDPAPPMDFEQKAMAQMLREAEQILAMSAIKPHRLSATYCASPRQSGEARANQSHQTG